MKKFIPLLAIIPMVLLALTPPWQFQLDCTVNSLAWLWAVLISGFLAFLFTYLNVSIWLKGFVIWAFVGCFISRAPFLSFTMYWSLIACAYFYALCRNISDWRPVFKVAQSLFFLVCLMLIMQLIGKDTLLNFKQPEAMLMGTIGNNMMFSSFICCLAPFLIINPLNWIPLGLIGLISGSSGGLLALGMGGATLLWVKVKRLRWLIVALIASIILYAGLTGDINTFFSRAGRGPVWKKTIELTTKTPLGHGIGTYKVLFPYLCGAEIRDQQPGREWARAHNSFLQIPFEVGIPGFILLMGWIVSIVRKIKNPVKLAGLMILAGVMSCQFPDRMCQSVLIILMFLAWCSQGEEYEQVQG